MSDPTLPRTGRGPLQMNPLVADKINRYSMRLVREEKDRDVVELTAKDDKAQLPIVIELLWEDDGQDYTFVYHGPPWKRHHAELYSSAACLFVVSGRDGAVQKLMAGRSARPADWSAPDKPRPVDRSVFPLPPKGPPCPKCGRETEHEYGYVGGRGDCWRHRCPGLDDQTCDQIERWQT